jgi:CRISPR-associated protein Cas2
MQDPSNWQEALGAWEEERRQEEVLANSLRPRLVGRVPAGWWQEAFADRPSASEVAGHPCGERHMLMIVAYDVTDPRRLARVARHCEDYGVRVQYSIFECTLEAGLFEEFWTGLKDLIEPTVDRIVAYRICAECARDIRTSGVMVSNEKVVAYVF